MDKLYNKILNEVISIIDFDNWDQSEQTFKEDISQSLRDAFIYKLFYKDYIKIYNAYWEHSEYYLDKIYINGIHIKTTEKQCDDLKGAWWFNICSDKKYPSGEYKVYIKDLKDIKNCYHMFTNCDQLMIVSLFDTCNVTNMGEMFWGCSSLQKVPLFDTSNVENMNCMFWECENLREVPLFDTKNVIYMRYMFNGCSNLEFVPLFDIKNVTNMEEMFNGAVRKLSKKTREIWSTVYNFKRHRKLKPNEQVI